MKTLDYVIMLLLVFVSLSAAQISIAPQEISVTTMALNKYHGPNGFFFYDSPAVQSDITFVFASGIMINAWHSTNFDRQFSNTGGDEIDWTIVQETSITDKILIASRFTYFDVVNLLSDQKADVYYSEVNLSYEVPISPFVTAIYSWPVDVSGLNAGWLFKTGATYGFSLWKLKVNNQLDVMYDTGVWGFKPGTLVEYAVNVNFPIVGKLDLNLSAKGSSPINFQEWGDGRKPVASAGIGLAYTF